MKEQELINAAERAMKKSYAPYSHFNVGAALLCKDGKLYLGANVENSSFLFAAAPSETPFSAPLTTESGSLRPLPLWAGKNHSIEKLCPPPAAPAARS